MKLARIAIVGAGPGGLTLARILQMNGIETTVFEGEASSKVRSQGGSLDMHTESGQFAIDCAGLRDEFAKIARYEDQETRVYDKYGVLHFVDEDVSGKDRPEVDRGELRQMLLDSVSDIRWGHRLSSAEAEPDGDYTLHFGNGISERFDLVIGADGAWSRLRPLVSDAQPIYSGILFVELGIDDVDERHPDIARLMGRGLTFALGDSKALIGHRDAHAHLGVYAALGVPEDWIEAGGLDVSSSASLRYSLAGQFSDWSPSLVQLIEESGEQMTPRGIYALPIGHRWEHLTGVTLLGDAAHLMSPFGGDGANLAMLDGARLALALVAALHGDGDWDAAVRAFETEMFTRAAEAAEGAWGAIQEVFSPGGLEHMVEQMELQRTGS